MQLTSGMEDKMPIIYSVMGSPHPRISNTMSAGSQRSCMSWASLIFSALGVIGACLALLAAVQQCARMEDLEVRLYRGDERITFLEAKLDALTALHVGGMDDLDYFDRQWEQLEGEQDALEKEGEDIVRDILQRKKRSIPVYEESYGVDFTKIHSKAVSDKLRLYETLSQSAEDWSLPATDDPIKPHHRVSSTWTSGRSKTPFEKEQVRRSQALRNKVSKNRPLPQHLEKASRVMATESAKSPSGPSRLLNSVTMEPAPQLVKQGPLDINTFSKKNLAAYSSVPRMSYTTKNQAAAKRKNRKHTRRSRGRSQITVAHFIASNNTMEDNSLVHRSWSPAPWMDKLGLNKKYQLSLGTVTVKEPGLYYIYAQVLYNNGRYGTGYQIMVDGIPVMECTLAPLEPTNSCHTSGVSYLPRNAAVVIRDLERYMTPVIREEASFFGLVKLLDAPASPEALILG